MNRDQLTKAQAKLLNANLRPTLGYLFRLRERLEKTGCPPNDPFYILVCRAYDALHALTVELHYCSVDGVGRPAKTDPPDDANGHAARPPPDTGS